MVVLLIACGCGGSDRSNVDAAPPLPHEFVGRCDPAWGVDTCENACLSPPATNGQPCAGATTPLGATKDCAATFAFGDDPTARGCCDIREVGTTPPHGVATLWECPPPHNHMACDPAWGVEDGGFCEAACAIQPTKLNGGCLKAAAPDGVATACSVTFEVDGRRGCCLPTTVDGIPTNGAFDRVLFFECAP